MKTLVSHSIKETEEFAAGWLKEISARHERASTDDSGEGHAGEATVVGLSGHLGAGKTAFVKAVAKALGITEEVTSPTFVIMKLYEIHDGENSGTKDSSAKSFPWKRLVHIDAYRLERREELDALNFEAMTADSHNLIMVEWPENVELEKIATIQKLSFSIQNNDHVIVVLNS